MVKASFISLNDFHTKDAKTLKALKEDLRHLESWDVYRATKREIAATKKTMIQGNCDRIKKIINEC